MAATSLLAFWAVAVLLIAVPGADWAFTLEAGLRRSVLPAVGGLVIGYLLLTALVATGVGVLVASSPTALGILTVAGGAYLIQHGVVTLARPPSGPTAAGIRATRDGTRRRGAVLARGIGVSGLNPKGLLIFMSLLPQFTSPQASWPVPAQIGVLGLAFVITCAVFYLALGSLAAGSPVLHPAAARLISRCSGVGMTVVGALLIVDRFLGA